MTRLNSFASHKTQCVSFQSATKLSNTKTKPNSFNRTAQELFKVLMYGRAQYSRYWYGTAQLVTVCFLLVKPSVALALQRQRFLSEWDIGLRLDCQNLRSHSDWSFLTGPLTRPLFVHFLCPITTGLVT